jgi:hypothetical protein
MKDFVRVGATQGRLVVLPLYADEREIADLVLGSRAERWLQVVRELERGGLPKRSELFGGLRYVPKVLQFFDLREGVTRTILCADGQEDGPENWGPV